MNRDRKLVQKLKNSGKTEAEAANEWMDQAFYGDDRAKEFGFRDMDNSALRNRNQS